MGTRCLTRVFDGDTEVCCIYRHWDGYPDGHGRDLKRALKGKHVVNGWSTGASKPEVDRLNGAGRVAAYLVAFLQAEGHNPNIMPPGTAGVGEEYEYRIELPDLDSITRAGPDGLPIKVKHRRV
jgi:hypothetical protein